MRTYEYRAFDAQGRRVRGLVEASSAKDARERLAVRGILAESIQASGRQRRIPVAGRAAVYRELSALVDAGLPLVGAFDVLIAGPETDRYRGTLAGIRDAVREGCSLADALVDASPSVTAFERAIVESAEKSAAVGVMLSRLADFLEAGERLRERVHNALIYPAIVFTVGICVALVMLGVLVPRAHALVADSGGRMPGLTAFMMGLGRSFVWWGPAAGLVVVGLPAALVLGLRRDSALAQRWDRCLYRLPVFGRGYRLLVNLRFSQTLGVLLAGGVSLIEALRLAGRSSGSPWVGTLVAVEAERVRNGSLLSEALARVPPLSGTLPGWVRVGEAGGGLARLLTDAGQRFQHRWDRYVTRVLSVLEPVLILLIGGFVLLVTLSVLLPVIALSRAVGS